MSDPIPQGRFEPAGAQDRQTGGLKFLAVNLRVWAIVVLVAIVFLAVILWWAL